MTAIRWLLAGPLALAAILGAAEASEVRDQAKMFSKDAVQQAQAALERVEEQTGVPTIIETVPSLGGASIGEVSLQRAKASGIQGVYLLIAQQEMKLAARDFRNFLGPQRRKAIESAFASGFRQGDFDAGLLQGTEAIAKAVAAAGPPPAGRAAKAPPAKARKGGWSGFGILLVIGAVIVGVLLLTRLFGRRAAGHPGYGAPGHPNAMRGQPGYGPGGYGAPGYGGRGGFWQGMLGGLGGAMAGNWLYDQFSGRHHGSGYAPPTDTGATLPPDNTAGADWGGGEGTSWGGGDDGGTSWGGGGIADTGGDWGGGGGDWGGGDGGDWT